MTNITVKIVLVFIAFLEYPIEAKRAKRLYSQAAAGGVLVVHLLCIIGLF